MTRIDEKIVKFQSENPGKKFYSFEFFPPRTEQGLENLYSRFSRMATLEPMWIDVTWGAGGSTSDKTIDICAHAKNSNGMVPMMHLTCTNMQKSMVDEALQKAKDLGIRNILALRGDPPANEDRWIAAEGGFHFATDLVRYIRENHGDYFCIAVAGYPEGHPDCTSYEDDLKHLVEKIDAGADLIVTQLFYNSQKVIDYIRDIRALGVTVPVLPGIMPIGALAGFNRMTDLCKVGVPVALRAKIDACGDDEEQLKAVGVEAVAEMCQELLDANVVPGLHFYTLNLEVATTKILLKLGMITEKQAEKLQYK